MPITTLCLTDGAAAVIGILLLLLLLLLLDLLHPHLASLNCCSSSVSR
jgi:hypothetical protein